MYGNFLDRSTKGTEFIYLFSSQGKGTVVSRTFLEVKKEG